MYRSILTWTVIWGLMAGLLSDRATAQRRPPKPEVTLTNLYDAFGRELPGLKHDFGFSTIIKRGDKTILFDAGTHNDIFAQNVRLLNADLRKVDIVIISHGHYDHMGGMHHVLSVNPKVKIYLPRDFFSIGAPTVFPFREPEPAIADNLPADQKYFRGSSGGVDGMRSEPSGRFWGNNFEYVTEAKEVLPGVTIVPTISELMGTFIRYPPFEQNPQLMGMPELSLSLQTRQGQVIVSGCSHSTIDAIIRETLKFKSDRILLVTGGFHLIPYRREYIEALAKRMKDTYSVEYVAPAHCSGHMGFHVFRETFGDRYRFFGLGETISF